MSASKQRLHEFIPETPTTSENFVEACGAKCVHIGQQIWTRDDGSVNAATNSPRLDFGWRCRRRHLLVANDPGGRCPGLACSPRAEPCQWSHGVQCRGLFLLPRRSQPARSAEARRRACNAFTVRDVLRSQHLVRSHIRYWPVERSGFRDGCAQGDVAGRPALFSGLSICVLPACDGRRRSRSLCLSEDAGAGDRQAARPRRAVSVQHPSQCRHLEMAVHGRQALHGGRFAFGVMESRRLSRQRSGPLRRVPQPAQLPRRYRRGATLRRRAQSGGRGLGAQHHPEAIGRVEREGHRLLPRNRADA